MFFKKRRCFLQHTKFTFTMKKKDLLLAALLLLGSTSFASITTVYLNDTIWHGTYEQGDADGDLSFDYDGTVYNGGSELYAYGTTFDFELAGNSSGSVANLASAGFVVDNSTNFVHFVQPLQANGPALIFPTNGDTDYYIPVEITINGNIHYGWLVYQAYGDGSNYHMLLKEIHYESVAGQPATITGGVTAIDDDVENERTLVRPTILSSGETLYLDTSGEKVIYDLSGKPVFATREDQVQVNLPAGIYVAKTGAVSTRFMVK